MSGFSNPVVNDINVLIRLAIKSPNFLTGISGWTINKDGSVEFNNGTFRGTVSAATIVGSLIESATSGRRTTLDANGDLKIYNAFSAILFWISNGQDAMWVYADTGSATQGALIASIANASGTDPFLNTYVQGIAQYTTISSVRYAMTMGNIGGQAAFFVQNQSNPATIAPAISAAPLSAASSELTISSGAGTVTASQSQINLEDSTIAAAINGLIKLSAGRVLLGAAGGAEWNDNTQTFALAAGTGPFIGGETFHTITLPTGLTGTLRVKKLPWNMCIIDCTLQFSYTAAIQSFTCGNLPDATYYPTGNKGVALFVGNAPTGIGNSMPRLNVPTSGAITIAIPAGSGASIPAEADLIYPTN